MKNVSNLKIQAEMLQSVLHTDTQQRRFLGVTTDILEISDNVVTVRVSQVRNLSGLIYSAKELIQYGQNCFAGIPDYVFHYRPIVWKSEGMDVVDQNWIQKKMDENGLSQSDIVTAMNSDKHVISKLLSGKNGLTIAWKAAFWWYFEAIKKG